MTNATSQGASLNGDTSSTRAHLPLKIAHDQLSASGRARSFVTGQAKNRYVGAISVGFGPDGKRIRRKVSGRTKAEVRDKLKAAHNELDRGLHTSATYTVRQAVDDWLEGGLPGAVGAHAVHLP